MYESHGKRRANDVRVPSLSNNISILRHYKSNDDLEVCIITRSSSSSSSNVVSFDCTLFIRESLKAEIRRHLPSQRPLFRQAKMV